MSETKSHCYWDFMGELEEAGLTTDDITVICDIENDKSITVAEWCQIISRHGDDVIDSLIHWRVFAGTQLIRVQYYESHGEHAFSSLKIIAVPKSVEITAEKDARR